MPTDEDRRALFAAAENTFGTRAANTLMELLPPAGWADVATRADLESHGNLLRREMAELRAELKGEMTELRSELKGEMAELRGETAELRGEIAGLRGETTAIRAELAGKIDGLGAELRGEIKRLDGRMMQTAFVSGVSAAGLVVAAAGTAAAIVALL